MEKMKWAAVIVLSMVLGAAVVVGVDALASDDPSPETAVATQEPASGDDNEQDGDSQQEEEQPPATISDPGIENLADLYERVRPSVVQIQSGDDALGPAGGAGSGIVLDKDGNILTNNHVVGAFGRIDVVFADGSAYPAAVVGSDPGNDLAVIHVDAPADKLVPAVLGDSDSVRAGESVFAVGNPFDLDGSVTEGIVSGIGRSLAGGIGRPLRELIQSDAAINPGNSGGALFNTSGEVIGVTTAIENPSGDRVFVGIGYAVPINLATRFMPQMLNGETVQHPRLGISLRDVTPSVAESLGLSVEEGVLILAVIPGSAADQSGLQGGQDPSGRATGDVITAVDGEPVRTFEDLANYIDTKQVGDVVEVTVVRDGSETNIDLTLEAWQST